MGDLLFISTLTMVVASVIGFVLHAVFFADREGTSTTQWKFWWHKATLDDLLQQAQHLSAPQRVSQLSVSQLQHFN